MGNEMIVLGIDPGLTIGIGLIHVTNGVIRNESLHQVKWEKPYYEFLDMVSATAKQELVVVVEDFWLLEKHARAQIGSRFETVQAIGTAKFWAHTHGYEIAIQPAALNEGNAKESGHAIPATHAVGHKVIAYNHAYHWLLENDHIKHRILSMED
jgi:hypothetical protein